MAAKKDDFSVKKISPKLGGERGTRNPRGPTSSHDLVEQMEFLYVQVCEAIDNSATYPVASPIVEVTLGNYSCSTETLPIRPNLEWYHVFAFDKSKGDVLSVTLKDGETNPRTVIAKRNFKLALDIPTRLPPDPRLAPQWYSMKNSETGHEMHLLMSVWFGTQADEVYSEAWFSDASDVRASYVNNTRPKLYLAPRLCYVRITIVSGHDLISNDGKRKPSCYVTATLGKLAVKTEVASSSSDPTWNRDLILVACEPLDGTVEIKLFDRVDAEHEECIGTLERKLSEMTAQKTPGQASALFYDIEPPVKVNPAGDTRRFSSRIKMKLATDQAYHVFDECSQYCSDYRAFAKTLWGAPIGKLEIGILKASGLTPTKDWSDGRQSMDTYIVAKYGNKWARTRTMINTFSPKWNEQYSWDVYEKSTVVTLGIYENCQTGLSTNNQAKDIPIGKVRIPLNQLEWNKLYPNSFPILSLGKAGLKKKGELELVVRLVSAPGLSLQASYRWMLPKAHYRFPLSLLQIEALRVQAVELNCINLAKTEPPLRNEVVNDILKPESKSFSLRKTKAHWERICRFGQNSKVCQRMYTGYAWIQASIIQNPSTKWKACAGFSFLGFLFFFNSFLFGELWWWFQSCFDYPCYGAFILYVGWELIKRSKQKISMIWSGSQTSSTPLILFDVKLSKLESPSLDELAEEFDSIPSGEMDPHVLRMRYDRQRKMMAKVMVLLGDIASLLERVEAVLSYLDDPFHLVCFCFVLFHLLRHVSFWIWSTVILVRLLNFEFWRTSMPISITNIFRRLPSKAHLML